MNPKTLALLASLSVTIVPGLGCSNVPSGVAPDALMVGIADSGTLVRLHPEQELVLELNANPVTRYQWRIDKTIDQTILLPDGSKFTQTSQQRSRGEQVGTQLLRFVAQQPGRTRLRMVYTNEQEGIVEGTPRYDLEVIVAPKPIAGR